jgi:hypothetical protein
MKKGMAPGDPLGLHMLATDNGLTLVIHALLIELRDRGALGKDGIGAVFARAQTMAALLGPSGAGPMGPKVMQFISQLQTDVNRN